MNTFLRFLLSTPPEAGPHTPADPLAFTGPGLAEMGALP